MLSDSCLQRIFFILTDCIESQQENLLCTNFQAWIKLGGEIVGKVKVEEVIPSILVSNYLPDFTLLKLGNFFL